MNHLRIYLCIFVGLMVFAARADQATAASPKRSVMISAVAWDAIDPDGELWLNFKYKHQLKPLLIPWRDRSEALPIDGPGELVFTRTVERDGDKVEEPVATALIPEGVTRALLILLANPRPTAGESAIKVVVLDDSYSMFPGQSVRFLNYTRLSLGGSLGGQGFDVASGQDRVVPANLPETNRLLPFKLACRDDAGGSKKLRSIGLPMAAGMRLLVFLIEDPARPGRVEMVLLRDRVEPESTVAAMASASR